ncbi:MAG: transketolase C-terminal domain-containing protein, partial [Bacteroidota bacterium]
RVLVLHEAARTAGFGAELAATIAEDWFGALDAPVIRIGSEDLPVPFSTSLEGPIYSAKGKLDAGIERLLAF